MQKKCYYVKHFHTIPPSYGGVSVYVKRLSLALIRKGLLSGAFYRKELVGIPQEYSRLFSVFPKHTRSFYVIPELPYLICQFRKYEIIHSHSTLNTSFAIWFLHKVLKKPVVYTLHNQMIDQELSLLNAFDLYCVRSLAKDSSVQFVSVSEESKQKLEGTGIFFKNKIKVIPAYIAPVEVGRKEDYLSAGLISFIENRKYILFYVQSFVIYNGVDVYGTNTMIDAFVELHKKNIPISLVFCLSNSNNDEMLNSLKKRISHAGLNNYVYWQIGGVSEMWPIIKGAQLYLRPTSTDGDSVLLREVLGLGVPCLASDVAIRPNGCYTYRYEDNDSLVNKTIEILKKQNESSIHTKGGNTSTIDYLEDVLIVYKSLLDK